MSASIFNKLQPTKRIISSIPKVNSRAVTKDINSFMTVFFSFAFDSNTNTLFVTNAKATANIQLIIFDICSLKDKTLLKI